MSAAVRSDRGNIGPWEAIVRWRLAIIGIGCRPTSDETWNGVLRDDAGVFRGPDAYLQPAASGGKIKPTNRRGQNMGYGNRYWTDGKTQAVTWWGSPSRYIGTDNYRTFRWTVIMSPQAPPLTSGIYNDQPTRFAETFYGDYFWIAAPLGFVTQGPYQTFNIAGEDRTEGGGTSCEFALRPRDGSAYRSGTAIASPDVSNGYRMWAGCAIAQFDGGKKFVGVEQPREEVEAERVVVASVTGENPSRVLTITYDLATEAATYDRATAFDLNFAPWVFSPDGKKAAAIRWNGVDMGGFIAYTVQYLTLALQVDPTGAITASVQEIAYRDPEAGDYLITARGIEVITEDTIPARNAGFTYFTLTPDESIFGLDYDETNTLRCVYMTGYSSAFGEGASRSYSWLGVEHVDCRERVLVSRALGADGNQYLLVCWHDQTLHDAMFADNDYGSPPSAGMGGSLQAPTLNGCAAVSADGQYLVVSVPMIRDLARVSWRPDTGYVHGGDWYNERKFFTAAWRRDPQTGTITQILDEAAIAELAGLPGETKVRLYPVAPI